MVCFAWSIALGKIIAIDNLKKQYIIVVEWCWMYKKNEELEDHLYSIVRLPMLFGILSLAM